MSLQASRFIPDFVEPMFTDEQTFPVSLSASGMEFISSISPDEKPLCTSAE